jgi:glutamate racemase
MIEGDASLVELKAVVQAHVKALTTRIGRPPTRAILGCTHYEIVADLFVQALPEGLPLIHQPSATVDSLHRYLAAHPEYSAGTGGVRQFLTTGQPAEQNDLVETFWGAPLKFQSV